MNRLQQVITLPFPIVWQKAKRFLWRKVSLSYERCRDAVFSSYCRSLPFKVDSLATRFDDGVFQDEWFTQGEFLQAVVDSHCRHHFDVLGSGWMDFSRRGDQKPYVSSVNRKRSEHILSLLPDSYQLIDWQLDAKSGFRWDESCHYQKIGYGDKEGVDVKVPWELARMQHLFLLARAYACSQKNISGFQMPSVYIQEFQNQILDFIATNPPRFGVNWKCTMDVAIRVANWLVAYDALKSLGADFDPDFEKVFIQSLYEHGLYIRTHLEWSPDLRANHYFADIVGLLFVAAYLPPCPQVDEWLGFSVQEFLLCLQEQFYPDGANFEASTAYHRLSAEMAVYGVALILGLPAYKDSIEPWVYGALEKMAEFSFLITRPDGRFVQIGDHDSGRFFKFDPLYVKRVPGSLAEVYKNPPSLAAKNHELCWDENMMDQRHVVGAISSLIPRKDFLAFAKAVVGDFSVVRSLSQGAHVTDLKQRVTSVGRVCGDRSLFESAKDSFDAGTLPHAQSSWVDCTEGVVEDLEFFAYPDFGLYLWRSPELFLSVRCGSVGQNGWGGHAHVDQLSIDLMIGQKVYFQDPGSYIYTAFPELRNHYRSKNSHNMPKAYADDSDMPKNQLFYLGKKFDGQCLYFGKEGFLGKYCDRDTDVFRLIVFYPEGLRVVDYGERLVKQTPTDVFYSNGYGKMTYERCA